MFDPSWFQRTVDSNSSGLNTDYQLEVRSDSDSASELDTSGPDSPESNSVDKH